MKKVIKLFFLLSTLAFAFNFFSCKQSVEVDTGATSNTDVNSGTDDDTVSGSQSVDLEKYWYLKSNIYHIWVKSFNDSDGDGIGDLNGIKNKLSYIKDDLGCDTIWLSPIFTCANIEDTMHGYDTTDYYSVNSKFGTKDELAALITAVHNNGMKIIFDFVPNHTSDQHTWFKQSAAGDSTYADWYLWSDTQLSASTNMTSAQWYSYSTSDKYYYGAFGGSMPDLNYANSAVRTEIKNIAKYWLDFGFDGMRVDAVRYLVERENSSQSYTYMDSTYSHTYFAELRELLDSYSSPKFMMCEAWIEGDRTTLEKYLGTTSSPEFNMVLDFDQGRPCYNSVLNNTDSFNFGTTFKANSASGVTGAGYASFLTNHDEYTNRIGTVYNGDEYAISQATALSLMRANVPIIYYGQELGMENVSGKTGDAALRGSFDWTSESSQAAATTSILKLNKALLKVRKNYSTLFANGTVTKLSSSDTSKLAYTITDSSTKLLCVYNLSSSGSTSTNFTSTLGTISAYSTLIGDKDNSSLSISSGTVTVTNLAPYAYRVYLLGDSSASNLYDAETYSDSHEVNLRTAYDNMYLRGSMNSWGADSMTGDANKSIFTITKSLTAGTTYEFKFSTTSSDWSGTNWGSPFESLTFAENTVFNATGSENIKVNITTGGTYTIIFDSYYGTVTVLSSETSEDTAKENTVYLRGGFTSWDNYKGIAMTKQSDGIYSVTFTPTAGDYSFKISKDNNSWDTQWGAATSGSMTLGSATSTSSYSNSSNFTVTLSASSTTITLNTTNNTVTVTASSE